MMKQIKVFTISILLVLTSIAFPMTANAGEYVNQSSNIFKFQQKLAMNGNVLAQYKLASMYERGDGVTASIEQAKHWYSRAAEAGSKPAMHRNTYLEAKEEGYDPGKNADWLESVKTEAGAHKAEAMYLLGQLYGEGLGVKKDLERSLELLKQVRILGIANVDKQIVFIQNEIDEQNKSEQQNKVARSKENIRLKQVSEEQLAAQQAKILADKEARAKQKAEAEKLAQAEKIRRYEKAMMQLQLEQQQIDKQQAWASGGDVASADDEI
jgi:hypothetical protein